MKKYLGTFSSLPISIAIILKFINYGFCEFGVMYSSLIDESGNPINEPWPVPVCQRIITTLEPYLLYLGAILIILTVIFWKQQLKISKIVFITSPIVAIVIAIAIQYISEYLIMIK